MSYYSKTLYPFIEKLIRLHNEDRTNQFYQLSVDDLDLFEQYEFASHLIEYYKRDLNCIYDNDYHDCITSSLITLLKHDSQDNKVSFSELVMEKVVKFYKPFMQELIEDIIGNVESEDYQENGFHRSYYKDNGESFWSKA